MNKGEIARQYFLNGYNCAQAVALAFCDELALPPETALRLVSGFGGGMGRLREVCGAFSGAVFVLSVLRGYAEPGAKEEKAALYRTSRRSRRAALPKTEALSAASCSVCAGKKILPRPRRGRKNIIKAAPARRS